MRYLLQTSKVKLIGFFLIDEKFLTLKQKLRLIYHFDGDIEKIVSLDFSSLKKLLKKKKDINIDFDYYFEKAQKLLDNLNYGNEENNKSRIDFNVVTILDKDYPFLSYYMGSIDLDFLPSPVIFYKGDLNILKSQYKISIVGTRNPDFLSLSFIECLIEAFKKKNDEILTVSGFAKGVDYKVHEQSITKGLSTVGILGNGINIVYPASNLFLYKRFIDSENLLISEYPPDTKPLRSNFPFRNRLISLLADSIILIQSGIPSGANITLEFAKKLNKEILIFNPGNFESFKGNLSFIDTGFYNGFFYIDEENIYLNKLKTTLSESMETNFFKDKLKFKLKNKNDFYNIYFANLKNNYYNYNYIVKKVFYLIFTNPYISFDKLVKITGLPISKLLSTLTILESEKMIYKNIENRYYPNYINLQKVNKFRRINEK